ncbi:unnamed protein product [Cuscuta campestris]|uniref:Uncharacterized protein n=1 Tax=Cuscuta campestris TaxID=132261 RepID=A0A484KUI8_9ASTE|nr:unnamed protein product [Cuscuta campestris]
MEIDKEKGRVSVVGEEKVEGKYKDVWLRFERVFEIPKDCVDMDRIYLDDTLISPGSFAILTINIPTKYHPTEEKKKKKKPCRNPQQLMMVVEKRRRRRQPLMGAALRSIHCCQLMTRQEIMKTVPPIIRETRRRRNQCRRHR